MRLPIVVMALFLIVLGCRGPAPDETVTIAIGNSPNSLDPRIGTDAQSERIGALLFDSLVVKDAHYEFQPALAISWSQPDPLTWLFHLRTGVHFHDGRGLTAEDAAFTINSMLDGSILTSKSGAFASVQQAVALDSETLVLHLKHPDASLLFNLSDGEFGVVPRNAGADFSRHPIGSGPFRLLANTTDKEVLVARNASYWQTPPHLPRVRFAIVPDAVTVALELEKGTVDIASNEIPLDMVEALRGRANLAIETAPASRVLYLNFNLQAGPLADARVRQAIAFSIDRPAIIRSIWRGQALPAWTLLPPGHWAGAPQADLYPHDIAHAIALLAAAGHTVGKDGVRLHLEMKTSQDDTTRLLAQVLQQQLGAAGIALTLRPAEFGTFFADVSAGRFQMYALNWVGSNEDPDIFHYAFGSDRFPPRGGNRGRYTNAQLDELLTLAGNTGDEVARRTLYLEIQQILARDVPALPLWYPNNELVHTTRITDLHPTADGNYRFLREARARW